MGTGGGGGGGGGRCFVCFIWMRDELIRFFVVMIRRMEVMCDDFRKDFNWFGAEGFGSCLICLNVDELLERNVSMYNALMRGLSLNNLLD